MLLDLINDPINAHAQRILSFKIMPQGFAGVQRVSLQKIHGLGNTLKLHAVGIKKPLIKLPGGRKQNEFIQALTPYGSAPAKRPCLFLNLDQPF